MRVTVDRSRCQGHAMCALYAEHLFELDDDGYNCTAPFQVRKEDEPFALKAEASCPEKAIIVEG
jgi:ferredoxin